MIKFSVIENELEGPHIWLNNLNTNLLALPLIKLFERTAGSQHTDQLDSSGFGLEIFYILDCFDILSNWFYIEKKIILCRPKCTTRANCFDFFIFPFSPKKNRIIYYKWPKKKNSRTDLSESKVQFEN